MFKFQTQKTNKETTTKLHIYAYTKKMTKREEEKEPCSTESEER